MLTAGKSVKVVSWACGFETDMGICNSPQKGPWGCAGVTTHVISRVPQGGFRRTRDGVMGQCGIP
jgi:hypothetical protein